MRPEYKDVELLAQTLWAGAHGVVLHIAKCDDAWVPWRPVEQRAELMLDALVRGLCIDIPSAGR